MCGIAGIIGSFETSHGQQLISDMLKVIEHRGPDSNGSWVKDGIAFGMQRLSIIDLAGGDQPIWSAEGVGIVFNGEIYNFKKLRNDLEKDGVVFTTHSDTEVILQLYLSKGLAAIDDLQGMFGICLYDPRIKKIILIRDRLGIKPVYYVDAKTTFAFGSEIKSILEILPTKPDINPDSIWHFLTLRYVPGPDSVWEGIKKLEPGHYLEYDLENRTFSTTCYWKLEFNSKKLQSKRNYTLEFENLFLSAVEKRLLAADVPVGILLSGGLDSSCIAAAAVELGHKNFHTFSIGFDDGGQFSELGYAKQVSDFIGSQHHELSIGKKQFMDFIDDFVWFADEPIADLASIPLYYISQLASKHVKVVLSGEGSDEILAGYDLDKLARKLFILKRAEYFPKNILNILPYQSFKILSKVGYSDFLKATSNHITNVFSDSEKKKLCKIPSKHLTSDFIRSLYNLTSSKEPIDQLQQAYCSSWLVEDLLMKADKMSMATSLELRVPFLDHHLVEWAATLPLEWKIGSFLEGFTTKRILRIYAKKRIPQEIINRPKLGFPVPAYKWIREEEIYVRNKLNDPLLANWINTKELDQVLVDLKNGSVEAAHKIWNIIILVSWLKRNCS